MMSEEGEFNLEKVLSSFYKIADVKKISYIQYKVKKNDDQWAIQMELQMKKRDSRYLVALMSKELWCFSINDEPLPKISKKSQGHGHEQVHVCQNDVHDNDDSNEFLSPHKSGSFAADYSKPNLPIYYAIFLKALRNMVYLNLSKNSSCHLMTFGNGCMYLENNVCEILQIEPHLFENNELAISLSLKPMNMTPLNLDVIDEQFSKQNAIYFAPSGIRAHLPSSDISKCTTSPPDNAETFLKTLYVLHGIDLINKKDICWIKLIPQLSHFNGQITSIAHYMNDPEDTRTISWPCELCFVKSVLDLEKYSTKNQFSCNINDAFSITESFSHLKQSSAYRTPGSSGVMTGTVPLSSCGAFTDQLQSSQKNMFINTNGSIPESTTDSTKNRVTPPETINSIAFNGKTFSNISDQVDTHEPVQHDINHLQFSNEMTISPDKHDILINGGKSNFLSKQPISNIASSRESSGTKELFGEEEEEEVEEEDLFGDSSSSMEDKPMLRKNHSDEITEDMFEMSDDDEESRAATTEMQNLPKLRDGKKNPDLKPLIRKRKYLDIPFDQITLSNSPLYVDPGAPLPIETPRDRRKSVFAPLNFNPIIENTVDNKYKNGGKFSFDPSHNEESLNFDISKNGFSTSEDDDSDASDDLDMLDLKMEVKSEESISQPFPTVNVLQEFSDSLPPNLIKSELLPSNYNNDITKNEQNNSIWKISQTDNGQSDSPMRGLENSISSTFSETRSSEISPRYSSSHEIHSQDTKSPPALNLDLVISRDGNKISSDSKSTIFDTMSNTVVNLPFLLRQIPISSIPNVFTTLNPSITLKSGDQSILSLLSEQIVFGSDMFENFHIPSFDYVGLEDSEGGLINDTMNELFTKFERLKGSQMIDKFYLLPLPSVFVKKHLELIKIRADSYEFSKYLNLKPSKKIKNLRLLLLTASYKDDCISFISNLCQTYIGFEFGFCELLKLSNKDSQGLMKLQNFDESALLLLAAQIVTYCSINKSSGSDLPLLIIIPLDYSSLTDLVEKTSKFDVIKNEVKSKIPNAQIFFKTVSMDFIVNPLTPIDDYYNVCMQIFNIIPNKSTKFASIADKHPDKISFRTLSNSNGSSAIHYDSFIHLAYARSPDKEWVFAAFSDSLGTDSEVNSWYIGTSKTAFDNACDQIWLIAQQFAARKYGKICLVLTRLNSILPDDELVNWRRLSNNNFHLAVVCVDDSNKFSLLDNDEDYPSFKAITKQEEETFHLNANDVKDYEIRNAFQSVYGVIYKNPLPLANSQHRCAIKSGALVRFKNGDVGETLGNFEVNLLNCPHFDSSQLLRTVISDFRNLAALNTWFGVSDGSCSHIPWHVLAVKKMMNTLVLIKITSKES